MREVHLLELDVYDGELDIRALLAGNGGTSHSVMDSGCHALMLAVFEDGIRSVLSPVVQVRREAETWLENRHARGPFAFAVLCETFGLEPHVVRRAVHRMHPGLPRGIDAAQRRRFRPNAQRVPTLR